MFYFGNLNEAIRWRYSTVLFYLTIDKDVVLLDKKVNILIIRIFRDEDSFTSFSRSAFAICIRIITILKI